MNKKLLVAIAIAAGFTVMQWKTVVDFYVDVYPSDPTKRNALNRCIAADKNFNRLIYDARVACYQQLAIEPMPVGAPVALVATGTAPRNDVRLVQQSDGSKQ